MSGGGNIPDLVALAGHETVYCVSVLKRAAQQLRNRECPAHADEVDAIIAVLENALYKPPFLVLEGSPNV